MIQLNSALFKDYDRKALTVGIIHLGLGAFHRAHQAVFIDQAIRNGHTTLALASVSMRKSEVADTLAKQDGLFTVVAKDGNSTETKVIGAITRPLYYARDSFELLEIAKSPELKAITLTVTEKAYVIDGPESVPNRLADLLTARYIANESGIALISCDNMTKNSELIKSLTVEVLKRRGDEELVGWVEKNVRAPNSMIDRIVPAITEEKIIDFEKQSGYRDDSLITTEPFNQWVIENDPISEYLAPAGVQFVSDVKPYELAKIRLFNGIHSTIAYLGELTGIEFIADAMAQPQISHFIKELQEEEVSASILEAGGIDLLDYAGLIRNRISNPTLKHRAEQIAMDGSQKLQQRLIDGMNDLAKLGLPAKRLSKSMAIWIHYLAVSRRVNDPLAKELIEFARLENPADAVQKILTMPNFNRPLNPSYFAEISSNLLKLRNEPALDILTS